MMKMKMKMKHLIDCMNKHGPRSIKTNYEISTQNFMKMIIIIINNTTLNTLSSQIY